MYSLESGSWSGASKLPLEPRSGACAAALRGGAVVAVFGGVTASGAYAGAAPVLLDLQLLIAEKAAADSGAQQK